MEAKNIRNEHINSICLFAIPQKWRDTRAWMMVEMEKRFRLGHIYEIELIMRCVYERSDEIISKT